MDDITTSNNRCQPQGIKPKPEPSTAAGTDASNSKYNLGGISLGVMQEKANQVMTYEWVCSPRSGSVRDTPFGSRLK